MMKISFRKQTIKRVMQSLDVIVISMMLLQPIGVPSLVALAAEESGLAKEAVQTDTAPKEDVDTSEDSASEESTITEEMDDSDEADPEDDTADVSQDKEEGKILDKVVEDVRKESEDNKGDDETEESSEETDTDSSVAEDVNAHPKETYTTVPEGEAPVLQYGVGVISEEAASVIKEDTEEPVQERGVWVENEDGSATIFVEEGKTYEYKDTGLKITFTKLPGNPGSITVKEVKLTKDQQETLGALTDTAWDITSDMEDGSFEYDLVLPVIEDVDADKVGVAYVEEEKDLGDAKKTKTVNDDDVKVDHGMRSVKAEKLDHFTLFIATYSDIAFSTPKVQYEQGETIFVEATGLKKSYYYRVDLYDPGNVEMNIYACAKGVNGVPLQIEHKLENDAPIGTWAVRLTKYDNKNTKCKNRVNFINERSSEFEVVANQGAPQFPTYDECIQQDDQKESICHKTSSAVHPYNLLTLSCNALYGGAQGNGGHLGENGSLLNGHEDDVPPINGLCPGDNEPQYCGDGIVNGEEQCDAGDQNVQGYCSNTCEFKQNTCLPDVNMVQNGGFESPAVTNDKKWDIYSPYEPFIGWNAEWHGGLDEYQGSDRPEDANIELHRGVNNWSPSEGSQYAELDTDWDGPDGSLNNEPASISLFQNLPTIDGYKYEVKYDFSPRPGTGSEENELEFKWDDDVKDTVSGDGSSNSNTAWENKSYEFTADSDNTEIRFTDLGTPNSLGTFLDHVSVTCLGPEEEECQPGEKWAYEVIDVEQGKKKNNYAIPSSRSDADQVLGEADSVDGTEGTFFALGKEGTLDVAFEHAVEDGSGDDLEFYEVTWNNRAAYTEETADVYGKQLASDDWTLLGSVSNHAANGISAIDLSGSGLSWVKYIRLEDTTDFSKYASGDGDGYDLDAIKGIHGLCSDPDPKPKQIPVYSGRHVCPANKPFKKLVGEYSVGSQDADGISVPLTGGKTYLLEASGTYQYANDSQRLADAAYGTTDDFSSWRPDIGTWGTNKGVTSLLGDLGSGVGVIEWDDDQNINASNVYSKAVDVSSDMNAQFLISDWYSDWYGNHCKDQSCMGDNSGALDLNVYECQPVSTVKMCKHDEEQNPLSGWELGLAEGDPVVPSTPINVSDGGGTDTVDLPAGKYLVKVNGTYRYGSAAMIADAGYSYRPMNIPSGCDCWKGGETLSIPYALMAKVDGHNTYWGAYTGAHAYFTIVDHAGGPMNVSVYDNNYTDNVNNGNFGFEVYGITQGHSGETGSNGCVTVTDVPFGEYELGEAKQPGWRYVSGAGSVSVSEENHTFSIVNHEFSGNLKVCKFEDINGDGQKGNEENFIEWSVGVEGQNGVSRGDDGCYTWNDLPEGEYTTYEEDAGGWQMTTGNNHSTHEMVNGETTTVLFGNAKYGKVLVNKYEDINKDGRKNFGENPEPDLSDWSFVMYDDQDQLVGGPQQTGPNGWTTFKNLMPGQYSICEKLQDGWVSTDIDHNNAYVGKNEGEVCRDVTVKSGETVKNFRFGNYKNPVTIVASKIVCTDESELPNRNGVSKPITAQTAENWVKNHTSCSLTPNWQFEWGYNSASAPGDHFVGVAPSGWTPSGLTDGDGVAQMQITDLKDTSRLKVREVLQEGYLPFTHDTTKSDVTAEFYCSNDRANFDNEEWINNPQYGETYYCVAWNVPLGSIQGRKYNDINGNGDFDDNEKSDANRLDGWEITLYDAEWDDIDSMETGDDNTAAGDVAKGQYRFVNVIPGNYHVCETGQDGWYQTEPQSGTLYDGQYCHTVTVSGDHLDVVEVQFGNFEGGYVQGRKYFDENQDGRHQGPDKEERLSGWHIRLYQDAREEGWEQIGDEAITEDNGGSNYGPVEEGQYRFGPLQQGTYYVCEVLKEGWTQTGPIVGELPYDNNGHELSGEQGQAVTNESGAEDEGPVCWETTILTSGQGNEWHKFGNIELGSVTVTKFNDENNDKSFDEGDKTLEGWTMNLENDSYQGSQDTEDPSGSTTFANLFPGTYTLSEDQQSGWDQTILYCRYDREDGEGPIIDQYNMDKVSEDIENNSLVITVDPGQHVECFVGNQEMMGTLLLEKSDDTDGPQKPNSIFTNTMKITSRDGKSKGVKVTDLPPASFTYVPGSWSASSTNSAHTGIVLSHVYASPGIWDLGDMEEGEVITLSYQVKINAETDAGHYPSVAYATGIGQGGALLAIAENSEYTNGTFAGTDVEVIDNTETPTGKADTEIEKKVEKVEGRVLGAETILPATGADARWIVLASSLFVLGFVLLVLGSGERLTRMSLLFDRAAKRTHAWMKMLLMIGLAFALAGALPGGAHADTAAQFIVRAEKPEANSREGFTQDFVSLDTAGREVTADCLVKGPNDAAFSVYETQVLPVAGGSSGVCTVGSSQLPDDGTYTFKVRATAEEDTDESNEYSVQYDTKKPGKPKYIEVTKENDCKNRIKLKTANDGQTTYVEVYHSKDDEFTVGDKTLLKTITLGPDTKYAFDDNFSKCGQDYYYAVRAFDDAGNASDVREEEITKTVEKEVAKGKGESSTELSSPLAREATAGGASSEGEEGVEGEGVEGEEGTISGGETPDGEVFGAESESKGGQTGNAGSWIEGHWWWILIAAIVSYVLYNTVWKQWQAKKKLVESNKKK